MKIFRLRNTAVILCVFCIASAIAYAQTFKTLGNFHQTDGWGPNGPLVQATDGYFYGTTNYDTGTTYGTLFKMTAEGSLFTGLFYFCPDETEDCGGYPTAGLVQGPGGALYGTTTSGGGNNGGVVFIFRFGKFTTLSNLPTGSSAYAPLVLGSDGSLYGTTYYGGTNGRGDIFKITYTGQQTVLYNFCSLANCADGAAPYLGGLVQGTDGNFYGTTQGGGSERDLC